MCNAGSPWSRASHVPLHPRQLLRVLRATAALRAIRQSPKASMQPRSPTPHTIPHLITPYHTSSYHYTAPHHTIPLETPHCTTPHLRTGKHHHSGPVHPCTTPKAQSDNRLKSKKKKKGVRRETGRQKETESDKETERVREEVRREGRDRG